MSNIASQKPVPIPWKVRVRLFATGWIPRLTFLASTALVLWLWTQRGVELVIVGQVDAVQVAVPASTDGMLLPLEPPLAEFDRVQADVALVARIDASSAQDELSALSAERARLEALIASEIERLRWEQQRLDADRERRQYDQSQQTLSQDRNLLASREHRDQLRRELADLQQQQGNLQLRVSESAARRDTLRIELQNLNRQRERTVGLVQRRATSPDRLSEIDEQIEVKQSVIAENDTVRTQLATQLSSVGAAIVVAEVRVDRASDRFDRLQDKLMPVDDSTRPTTDVDVETTIEPLRLALAVQDAKIRQVARRIASSDIYAPVTGMISQVHHPPGTYVRAGDPIVTIASEDSRWILAYVDQQQAPRLEKGASVQVRIRGRNGVALHQAKILEFGTQFEILPEQLRRSPELIQWGLPIKISMPAELSLLPGEMVDLVLRQPSVLSPIL